MCAFICATLDYIIIIEVSKKNNEIERERRVQRIISFIGTYICTEMGTDMCTEMGTAMGTNMGTNMFTYLGTYMGTDMGIPNVRRTCGMHISVPVRRTTSYVRCTTYTVCRTPYLRRTV